MPATYTQRLNLTQLNAQLRARRGGVMQEMLRRGLLVETQAKRNLGGTPAHPKRVDTGRLRASLSTQVVEEAGDIMVIVSTNVKYARFVHDGTGLYGPRHRRIRPRTARVLRWTSKGRVRYARSTAGMRPNHFLRDALVAARG